MKAAAGGSGLAIGAGLDRGLLARAAAGILAPRAKDAARVENHGRQVIGEDGIGREEAPPSRLEAKEEEAILEVGQPDAEIEEGELALEEGAELDLGQGPEEEEGADDPRIELVEEAHDGLPDLGALEEGPEPLDDVALVVGRPHGPQVVARRPEEDLGVGGEEDARPELLVHLEGRRRAHSQASIA